jgi:hypothetical protein
MFNSPEEARIVLLEMCVSEAGPSFSDDGRGSHDPMRAAAPAAAAADVAERCAVVDGEGGPVAQADGDGGSDFWGAHDASTDAAADPEVVAEALPETSGLNGEVAARVGRTDEALDALRSIEEGYGSGMDADEAGPPLATDSGGAGGDAGAVGDEKAAEGSVGSDVSSSLGSAAASALVSDDVDMPEASTNLEGLGACSGAGGVPVGGTEAAQGREGAAPRKLASEFPTVSADVLDAVWASSAGEMVEARRKLVEMFGTSEAEPGAGALRTEICGRKIKRKKALVLQGLELEFAERLGLDVVHRYASGKTGVAHKGVAHKGRVSSTRCSEQPCDRCCDRLFRCAGSSCTAAWTSCWRSRSSQTCSCPTSPARTAPKSDLLAK